jgi:hypothetical protein
MDILDNGVFEDDRPVIEMKGDGKRIGISKKAGERYH